MATPGKFEQSGAVGEALHHISMDGGADAQLGDVESFGFYELFDGVKLPGHRKKVYAIGHENDQGFYDVELFDTREELQEAWEAYEADYDDYLSEADDGEDEEEEEYRYEDEDEDE